MESFPRLRALGCVVCGDPVSPCPSPACPPELFREVAPVVYRSVLLSSSYPQFTRQELESKLQTGEIERFQNYLQTGPRCHQDPHGHLPILAGGNDSMTAPQRQKTFPGYFSNLQHLQKQLVSGNPRWRQPTGQKGKDNSPKTSSRAPNTKTSVTTTTYGLFPPILDVWAQRDAMQRSITLRI
ncbi:hypothetical protein GDO81_002870 [Engystomops pustulosus]|uniref:Uncharacterized protein n=1 Tax=Engystomops pustulosus TaxID=76066 RepID=A0AAV7DNI1_ENGPU|nr:hypothetical protein GDO81_002870 [Engystomops pustulosus]KAG8599078.1 hypothetical protein GDO81_002870 [Engystomops pustulosus]KAG8599079.1 hypothetical protein GDO81_002870 [Engystomops pustulosus]